MSAGGACPRLAVGQKCVYRHDGIALLGVQVPSQGVATGGSTVEIALMAMMQQQKDFFVQSQAQAAQQAAATLAGQQQLSELMGTSLPRILVNSDVTSIPVAHQFVVTSSNDVCDTCTPGLLPIAVLDSTMS